MSQKLLTKPKDVFNREHLKTPVIIQDNQDNITQEYLNETVEHKNVMESQFPYGYYDGLDVTEMGM